MAIKLRVQDRDACIWRGDLSEVFLRYDFRGLIFGGVYTWKGFFSEFCGRYGKISNSLNTMAPNVKRFGKIYEINLVLTEIWEKESNRIAKLFMEGNEL